MLRTCRRCGKSEQEVSFYDNGRNICKVCWRLGVAARRQQLQSEGRCIECRVLIAKGPLCADCKKIHLDRHHANREYYNSTSKSRRQRLKLEALNAYGGPHCICCGESHTEFLTIDHIEQNGAAHRRSLIAERGWTSKKGSMCGAPFYFWLKQNDFPPGYRVLCLNCNFAISHFGYCPHTGKLKADNPSEMAEESAA